MVVTKDEVSAGSTHWAQGGIAWVQAEGDTVQQHIDDTLVAGAGLCIEDAVRVLVTEGPDEVAKLINRGAEFDRDLAGRLELTREGGHMRNRIAHAGGDATGAEIERALIAAVTADRGIEIVEHALVLDLIPAEVGPGDQPAVAGVTLHVLGEGTRGGVGAVHARAVVLATGGIGQIYAVTTNPTESDGGGLGMVARAGAVIADPEFVQFHPTAIDIGLDPAQPIAEIRTMEDILGENFARQRFSAWLLSAFSIVALVLAVVAFLPLLGWANWLIIPLAIIGAGVGVLGQGTAGRNLNLFVIVVGIVRLMLGGGIL